MATIQRKEGHCKYLKPEINELAVIPGRNMDSAHGFYLGAVLAESAACADLAQSPTNRCHTSIPSAMTLPLCEMP